MNSNIDWSVFDKYSESTNKCRCGAVYRSHCKGIVTPTGFSLITRKPCPGCGKSVDNVWSSSTDVEEQILE